MSATINNPFKHRFVRELMNEDEDDEEERKKQESLGIPIKALVMDLSFVSLTVFTLILTACYFAIALTGYGWHHSVRSIMESEREYQHGTKLYIMFAEDNYDMELASFLLFGDCALIVIAAVLSTSAIYESAGQLLIWSFTMLVLGIPLEILVTAGASFLSGGGCNSAHFEKKLNILIHNYITANITKLGYEAVKKLNSLQRAIECCGIKSYKDYHNQGFDPPSSCCRPSWNRNLYCALNSTTNAEIAKRLNSEGCVDTAMKLCDDVLTAFTVYLRLVIVFRIVTALIQSFLLYLELHSYQKLTEGGLSQSIEKIKARNAAKFNKEPSEVTIETAEDETSIKEFKKKRISKKGKSYVPKPSNTGTTGSAAEKYLLLLKSKGHGAGFSEEIQRIEMRQREKEEQEAIKEAKLLIAAAEEERLRQIALEKERRKSVKSESSMKKKAEDKTRGRGRSRQPRLKNEESVKRPIRLYSELDKRLSQTPEPEKKDSDEISVPITYQDIAVLVEHRKSVTTIKSALKPPRQSSSTSTSSSTTTSSEVGTNVRTKRKPTILKVGQPHQHHHRGKTHAPPKKEVGFKFPQQHKRHSSLAPESKPKAKRRSRQKNRTKSIVLDEPAWVKSSKAETNVAPGGDVENERRLAGETGVLRRLSIRAELDVPVQISSEEEEERKRIRRRKNKHLAASAGRKRTHLRREKNPKEKNNLVLDEWKSFW